MERVIKFRAYNPKEKKMSRDFTLYEIASAGSKTIFPFGFIANKDTVLMQYTGLKDKNGKEIYEGDIVEEEDFIGEVVWEDFMFNVEDYYDSSADYPTIAFFEGVFEVVGNIYENPNLIEDNK